MERKWIFKRVDLGQNKYYIGILAEETKRNIRLSQTINNVHNFVKGVDIGNVGLFLLDREKADNFLSMEAEIAFTRIEGNLGCELWCEDYKVLECFTQEAEITEVIVTKDEVKVRVEDHYHTEQTKFNLLQIINIETYAESTFERFE